MNVEKNPNFNAVSAIKNIFTRWMRGFMNWGVNSDHPTLTTRILNKKPFPKKTYCKWRGSTIAENWVLAEEDVKEYVLVHQLSPSWVSEYLRSQDIGLYRCNLIFWGLKNSLIQVGDSWWRTTHSFTFSPACIQLSASLPFPMISWSQINKPTYKQGFYYLR